MEQSNTHFGNRCIILGQLWLEYKHDAMFEDFVEYNDIGLPLAFSIAEGIVSSSPLAEQYINETWELFIMALDIEDLGFQSLEEILENFK